MGAMAFQIISLTIAYSTSTVYLGTDQRKHQHSLTIVCVWGGGGGGEFTGDRWISRTKGQ